MKIEEFENWLEKTVPNFKKWQNDNLSGTEFVSDETAQGIYRNGARAAYKEIMHQLKNPPMGETDFGLG